MGVAMHRSDNVATACFTEIAEVAQCKMPYFRFLRILLNVSVLSYNCFI